MTRAFEEKRRVSPAFFVLGDRVTESTQKSGEASRMLFG